MDTILSQCFVSRETTFSTIFTPSPWFFTAAHHVEKPWASLEVTQGRDLTNTFTTSQQLLLLLSEKCTYVVRNDPNEEERLMPKPSQSKGKLFSKLVFGKRSISQHFPNAIVEWQQQRSRQRFKLHHEDFL